MYTFVPVSDDELNILTDIAEKIDNGLDEDVEPFCDNEELSVLHVKVIDCALADVENEEGYFLLREIGMFARALCDYVTLKYREYIKTDGPDHVFKNYNQIHVPELFRTHNDGDEMLRFKEKFDELIVNLKLSNVITEISRNKKISPDDIKTYTNENHRDISHVASATVNQTIQSSIHEGGRRI